MSFIAYKAQLTRGLLKKCHLFSQLDTERYFCLKKVYDDFFSSRSCGLSKESLAYFRRCVIDNTRQSLTSKEQQRLRSLLAVNHLRANRRFMRYSNPFAYQNNFAIHRLHATLDVLDDFDAYLQGTVDVNDEQKLRVIIDRFKAAKMRFVRLKGYCCLDVELCLKDMIKMMVSMDQTSLVSFLCQFKDFSWIRDYDSGSSHDVQLFLILCRIECQAYLNLHFLIHDDQDKQYRCSTALSGALNQFFSSIHALSNKDQMFLLFCYFSLGDAYCLDAAVKKNSFQSLIKGKRIAYQSLALNVLLERAFNKLLKGKLDERAERLLTLLPSEQLEEFELPLSFSDSCYQRMYPVIDQLKSYRSHPDYHDFFQAIDSMVNDCKDGKMTKDKWHKIDILLAFYEQKNTVFSSLREPWMSMANDYEQKYSCRLKCWGEHVADEEVKSIYLLVHGWRSGSHAWSRFACSTKQKGTIFLAYDQWGAGFHGLRVKRHACLDLASSGALLRTVLVSLRKKYPHATLNLVGHSLGAALLILERERLNHFHALSSVHCISPPVLGPLYFLRTIGHALRTPAPSQVILKEHRYSPRYDAKISLAGLWRLTRVMKRSYGATAQLLDAAGMVSDGPTWSIYIGMQDRCVHYGFFQGLEKKLNQYGVVQYCPALDHCAPHGYASCELAQRILNNACAY